jgi:hypothetical protein
MEGKSLLHLAPVGPNLFGINRGDKVLLNFSGKIHSKNGII